MPLFRPRKLGVSAPYGFLRAMAYVIMAVINAYLAEYCYFEM
jgi:hypothetical protein